MLPQLKGVSRMFTFGAVLSFVFKIVEAELSYRIVTYRALEANNSASGVFLHRDTHCAATETLPKRFVRLSVHCVLDGTVQIGKRFKKTVQIFFFLF